ncbi:MAG TPA: maleylpyruvate isomerase N-terminal domain-containing protein [Terriglobia bacterium]|nr:maleylpyruvate isomerase N-terminal domain-containing protein [Terriglobia bacterium]
MEPILIAHLYPKVEARLLEVLRSLSPEDWEKQTIAPKWKVKDVAAHLLDTQLRRLSICRDGHALESPGINENLAAFINRMNAEGVANYRRLSPAVLISLMETVSAQSAEYHSSLDPFADALFPVSWAGDHKSPNWFDTARELTERWHHQQQIRLAVNKPGIMTRELYFPVLDCFMRALPFTYRTMTCKPGTFAQFNIVGDCGGSWFLYREAESWQLAASALGTPESEATIPQEIAWRIFTKGIGKEAAISQVSVSGNRELGLHILNMVSIVG